MNKQNYKTSYREFKGAYMASHEEVFFWSRAKNEEKKFKIF